MTDKKRSGKNRFVQIRIDSDKLKSWDAFCAKNKMTRTDLLMNGVDKFIILFQETKATRKEIDKLKIRARIVNALQEKPEMNVDAMCRTLNLEKSVIEKMMNTMATEGIIEPPAD